MPDWQAHINVATCGPVVIRDQRIGYYCVTTTKISCIHSLVNDEGCPQERNPR